MLKTWLGGLAAEQKQAGGNPPLVSPNVLSMSADPMAIWGNCVILVPWDFYQSSGDAKILETQFESMEDWLERGIPRIGSGLWEETDLGQLGDWLDPAAPPDKPGKGISDSMLVANAFLIKSTDVMAETCGILGYEKKAKKYRKQAVKLRAAFADKYITPSGRVPLTHRPPSQLQLRFLFSPPRISRSTL